jgi:hypothetical protein
MAELGNKRPNGPIMPFGRLLDVPSNCWDIAFFTDGVIQDSHKAKDGIRLPKVCTGSCPVNHCRNIHPNINQLFQIPKQTATLGLLQKYINIVNLRGYPSPWQCETDSNSLDDILYTLWKFVAPDECSCCRDLILLITLFLISFES